MSFLKRLFDGGKTQSQNRTQAPQEPAAQTPPPPKPLQARAASPQRTAQTDSAEPFTDNGDGTVTDIATGLIWQKDDDGRQRTWNAAMEHAKSMTLASYSNWRLPSKDELIALSYTVRRNSEAGKAYFPGMKSSDYWTSTTYENNEGDAYYVTCDRGNPYSGEVSHSYSYKTGTYYVLCVRSTSETVVERTDAELVRSHRGLAFRVDGEYSLVHDEKKVIRGIWYRDRNDIGNSRRNRMVVANATTNGFTVLDSDYEKTIVGGVWGVEDLENPGGAILWFDSTRELFGK